MGAVTAVGSPRMVRKVAWAVHRGRVPGVYSDAAAASNQVTRFAGSNWRSFTEAELGARGAAHWLREQFEQAQPGVVVVVSGG